MNTTENKTDVDTKTVEGELDEIGAFLKRFDKEAQEAFLGVFRDIDSYLDVILPDRKSQDETDETEFPEFAPIEAFLKTLTDREKVICALMVGLSLASNNSSCDANRYLENIWQTKQKACRKAARTLTGDPEFGNMALIATIFNAMAD